MSSDSTTLASNIRTTFGKVQDRIDLLFFAPVSAIRLDLFRRCFTLTFLAYMAFRFTHAREWLTDFGYHSTSLTIHPGYPAPWPTLPAAWIIPFGILIFGSGLIVIAGFLPRFMSGILFACSFYVMHVDWTTSYTLNKLYLVTFLVLALSPSIQRSSSGDDAEHFVQVAWPIRILQATLLLQYFTAGTCKVFHGDWNFSHPDVLWTHVQGTYRTALAGFMLQKLPKFMWTIMMFGSLAFELTAPLLFTRKRLIGIGIAWGILFHISIALTMHNLIYFSIQMMSFYILWLPDNLLQRFADWLPQLQLGGKRVDLIATSAP